MVVMARPLRLQHPEVWYHVTSRGNGQQRIFKSDKDRLHLRQLLAETVERFKLRLFAYVFMSNHYHLVLEAPQGNLSRAMQWLNVSYSAWFNRRHGEVGHLFQGRFKAIVVEPRSWGLRLTQYVHLNPVRTARWGLSKSQQQQRRRGLTTEDISPEKAQKRLQQLRQYAWSSYRAYLGLESIPAWLSMGPVLAMTGEKAKRQQSFYLQYVEEAKGP